MWFMSPWNQKDPPSMVCLSLWRWYKVWWLRRDNLYMLPTQSPKKLQWGVGTLNFCGLCALLRHLNYSHWPQALLRQLSYLILPVQWWGSVSILLSVYRVQWFMRCQDDQDLDRQCDVKEQSWQHWSNTVKIHSWPWQGKAHYCWWPLQIGVD